MAKKKGKRPSKFEPPRDAREARVMEAARRAYRLAKEKLHEARDPAASKAAYESVWAATDDVGKAIVESVEDEDAEEDPDVFTDEHGVEWRRVTEDGRT